MMMNFVMGKVERLNAETGVNRFLKLLHKMYTNHMTTNSLGAVVLLTREFRFIARSFSNLGMVHGNRLQGVQMLLIRMALNISWNKFFE